MTGLYRQVAKSIVFLMRDNDFYASVGIELDLDLQNYKFRIIVIVFFNSILVLYNIVHYTSTYYVFVNFWL